MDRPRKPSLSPGDMVAEHYRVEGAIGQGGFGAIYEAVHVPTGTRVALKVLHANFSTRKTDSKRFRREAALVKNLLHPNVVRLLDFGETDRGVPYIAFELLQGKALDTVIEKWGALPLARVGEIARDLLRGLGAAHLLGIVHRDIKPANVFLCEGEAGPGPTKVLDFGIAKALSGEVSAHTELTKDGQMVGTPFYMAPEQVRGTEVGPQTDLYAVGLVMVEMISGERAIGGDSLISVYMAQIADTPLELPESVLASPWAAIIAKATHKPLPLRYGSAREMVTDVEAVLEQSFGVAARRVDTTTAATAVMPDRRKPAEALPASFEVDDEPTHDVQQTSAFAGLGSLGPLARADEPPPASEQPASEQRISRYGTVVIGAHEQAPLAAHAVPLVAPTAQQPVLWPAAAGPSGWSDPAAQVQAPPPTPTTPTPPSSPSPGALSQAVPPWPAPPPAVGGMRGGGFGAQHAVEPPGSHHAGHDDGFDDPGPAPRSRAVLVVTAIVVAVGLAALAAVALTQ